MTPIHAKSRCCNAQVRRFGKRRRQCINCKRTWRIRQKKRGRPHTRHSEHLLKRILIDGHTFKDEARNFRIKTVSIAARFANALRAFVASPPPPLPKGPYVLVVDGVYFKFQRKECQTSTNRFEGLFPMDYADSKDLPHATAGYISGATSISSRLLCVAKENDDTALGEARCAMRY